MLLFFTRPTMVQNPMSLVYWMSSIITGTLITGGKYNNRRLEVQSTISDAQNTNSIWYKDTQTLFLPVIVLFKKRIENQRYVRDTYMNWYETKLRDYNIHLLTKISYKPNFTSPFAPCVPCSYIVILSQSGNCQLG